MPDQTGKLTETDLPALLAHFGRSSPDGALTCPVTGARVLIERWRVSDRFCMIPMSGAELVLDLRQSMPLLCCTSPAGGIVFLGALDVGLIARASSH